MAVLRSITEGARRFTGRTRRSVIRARLEAEHRALQRAHRAALESLGRRAGELVRSGRIPDDDLGAELAEVRQKEMLIAAKAAEIDMLAAGDAAPTPG